MTARGFFAWLLMILGSLAALLAGGCSLFFLPELLKTPSDPYVTPFSVFLFGGIPFLAGALVFALGYLLRPKKADGHEGTNHQPTDETP